LYKLDNNNNKKATKKFSQNLALKAISHSIQFLVLIAQFKLITMPYLTLTALQTGSVSSGHSFFLFSPSIFG
jgi:hypothetical protein